MSQKCTRFLLKAACDILLTVLLALLLAAPVRAEITASSKSTYAGLSSNYSMDQKLPSGLEIDGLAYYGFRYGRFLFDSHVYPDPILFASSPSTSGTRIGTLDGTEFDLQSVKLQGLSVGVGLDITGWRDGVQVASNSAIIQVGLWATIQLDFQRIDEVRFSGLLGRVAIDDLTFGPRSRSTDNRLNALSTDSGPLAPSFEPDVTAYTLSVGHEVDVISLTAGTADPAASLLVANAPALSGQSSAPVALSVGTTTIPVRVTAEDGGVRTYTVAVTRAVTPPSSDARLTSLVPSEGALSPAFDSTRDSYGITLDHDVGAIAFIPTTADAAATVTVAGQATASGSSSAPVALPVGQTDIPVEVVAEDGTERVYTISVIRAARPLRTEARLASLMPSNGSLSPAFDPDVVNYDLSVAHQIAAIDLSAETLDPTASLTIAGLEVLSGHSSGPVALPVGTTVIPIEVRAEDGTTRTYTVAVARAGPTLSADASLASLAPSDGALSPAFDPDVGSYALTVGHDTAEISFVARPTDGAATMAIEGQALASNVSSAPIPLPVGVTTVRVQVTAEDGTGRAYTIVVTRADPPLSSNADLVSLVPSDGALSPAFEATIGTYDLAVNHGVTDVTLTATTADPAAVVTIAGEPAVSGQASAAIGLAVGRTEIAVRVTAENGSSHTYTVAVTRADPPSSDATLASLVHRMDRSCRLSIPAPAPMPWPSPTTWKASP